MDWFTFKLILFLISTVVFISGCTIIGFFMAVSDVCGSSSRRDKE